MESLKIGVLTFHRCINYGSYWQARCLVEKLMQMGHQAVLLDHFSQRVNLAEWKCALQPTLPTPVPKEDYPYYRQKIESFFQSFGQLPLSAVFPLEQPSKMDFYDLVVVGSDEVWNLFHPWYGGNTFFYGEGIKAKRLLAYAASFGNYQRVNGLPEGYAEKLRLFDAISVRDDNSRHLVFSAIGKHPELVLDPCLAFPLPAGDIAGKRFAKPYAAIYGHNFSAPFISRVKEWAKQGNVALVSIGYRNDWTDETWLSAGPHDFAHFIAHAAVVATNFFHGCVFALQNEKPFVCESTDYRNIKVRQLLQQLDALPHIMDDKATEAGFDRLLSLPLNACIVANIRRLRHHSVKYLESVLSLSQCKTP